MIPQAGSAYAYSYATLGELVAWIIGWDLILEYAVGNVAVAISWGDYFNTLLRGFGADLPVWMTTGYRTALLSSNPEIHGLLTTAPRLLGIPLLVHLPAAAIVMVITWLLLRGARESATTNNIMVVIKLIAIGIFIAVGATHLHAENYRPFAPNGFTGVHQDWNTSEVRRRIEQAVNLRVGAEQRGAVAGRQPDRQLQAEAAQQGIEVVAP